MTTRPRAWRRKLVAAAAAVAVMEAVEPRVLLAMPTLWTSHGPGGGGSFFAAAMSGDNLWIASDMSGIYRSANLGQSWQMQNFHASGNTGGIRGGSASQVSFTSDPSILYIPNSSLGVAKSTNGGATWSKLTGWTNGTAYWMAADPTTTTKVLVANANNLYVSTNGGTSFTSAYASSGLYVAGALFDGSNVYVGTNKGLLVSTNGGTSFSLSPTQLPAGQYMISFAGAKQGATTRLLAVTSTTNPSVTNSNGTSARSYGYSKLWRLDVGAAAWVDKSSAVAAVASGETPKFVGMARDNISVAYLGGADAAGRPQVLKTTNGGDAFADVFFTRTVDGGGIPNKNTLTGYSGQNGDFDWSWGGTPWTFVVSSSDPNRAMMGNSGFIHLTTDGGATWRQAYLNPADQNPAGANTPKNKPYRGVGVEDTSVHYLTWTGPTNIMAAYTDTTGWRSTDGGASWAYPQWNGVADNTVYKTEVAPDGKLYGAASNVHDMYQSNYLLDSRTNPTWQNGRVIVSSDQGATWSLVHEFGKPVVWIQSDPRNANRMYAMVVDGIGSPSGGADGGVWVTNNLSAGAASTWTKLPNPPRTEGHPYYLRILDDGTLVATFSGRRAIVDGAEKFTASSGVFVSTDDGQTWLDRSHVNMRWYTKGITIDPTDPAQNTWYAAVANGWSGTGNDLGDVYRTTDRGVTWTKMNLQNVLGVLSMGINSVTINPTTREMYVATEVRGLFYAPDVRASGFSYTHFSDVTSFPFSWNERVFVNPYDAKDVWVASFGGGIWRGGAAPSGLGASASGATQINLSWSDNSGNEAAFEIDRATNSTFTAGLVTTTAPVNATSAAITGLAPGTTYYFRVRAINGSSKSADSASASAATASGDATPPAVVSINRVSAAMTGFNTVQFTVTFSENVTGVDATDFVLATSGGVTGASIAGVVASNGSAYVVTVNTGSGDGTLGLNLVDNDTIADAAGNKLGGAGSGNGNFSGQAYTVAKADPVFTGGAGGDTFYFRRNGAAAEVFAAASPTGAPVYSTTYTNLRSITFDLGGGNDAVIVDHAGGNPIPATGGVLYHGGAGANTLSITAAAQGGTVTLTGGDVALAGAPGAAANLAIVVNAGAALAINSSQRLARLGLAGGNASVTAGGTVLLDVGVLEIAAASRLDLADNDMILRGTSRTAAEAFVRAARNGGTWDGTTGLRTSMADAATDLTTLAVAPAASAVDFGGADTALWNGATVSATDVLVKYTYAGDANLDGAITGDDYAAIDLAILFAGSDGYFNGDFNHDGVITGDDYSVIDLNILLQGQPL